MAECQSCHAEVVFVPSAKSGKPMILDAKPTKGVVRVDGVTLFDGVLSPIHEGPLGVARAMIVDVYTDHHVTCPNADDWKSRTRASAS